MLDQTVQFRGGSLVEPRPFFQPKNPNRVQNPQGPQPIDVARVLRLFKRDFDVALCAEIVDLGELHLLDHMQEAAGVREVPIMEDESSVSRVRILVEMSMRSVLNNELHRLVTWTA
jgi:hypothetical protein